MLVLPVVDTLLFFGSFDPFTLGHVHVVEQGLAQVKPKLGVKIIPAWASIWHKDLSAFDARATMIQLSIEAIPAWKDRVACSLVEQINHFSGRTLETLSFYQQQFPQQRFGILMGSDSLKVFQQWYRWEEILRLAPVFVAMRDDDEAAQLQEFAHVCIYYLPPSGQDARLISSTQARNDVQVRGHTEHVLPEVLEYIKDNRLYS